MLQQRNMILMSIDENNIEFSSSVAQMIKD